MIKQLKTLLHRHKYKYYWDLSLRGFWYYYKCDCGKSVTSGLPPSMFGRDF